MRIADACSHIASGTPGTFFEAIQLYWFGHELILAESVPSSVSLGRFDYYLTPYYERDIREGRLTRKEAWDLVASFWTKCKANTKGYQNLVLGGTHGDGRCSISELTYICLDVTKTLKYDQPSVCFRWIRDLPDRAWKEIAEVIRTGTGFPALFNEDVCLKIRERSGIPGELAWEYAFAGCVEIGIPGKEYTITEMARLNLPKILELTLNDGYDQVSGQQLGLKLGRAEDFADYDALFDAFNKQLKHFIDIKIKGSNIIEKIYAKEMPVPFLSVMTNDCIARGMDYNGGGARYNTKYLQGVGIGTITDALASIKYNVYDEHRFTMGELMQALDDDFEGHEELLNQVRSRTPKYGNDDDYADEIMKAVFASFRSMVSGRPNMLGGMYRINMLPTTCHVYFGEVMMASANGRKAHKPVSEGISPEKGADVNGPTAVIQSAAKMDHLQTGGTLLNQKFAPDVLKGEEGLEQMANLIRTYFNMDGHHIQVNVIDRQTLIDAQLHPQEHADLIVRVAGYSDHFRNLSKALQDEIIERTEQRFY